MLALLTQKKLSLGELIALSWQQFTLNFKNIALISIIVFLPINIFLAMQPTQEEGNELINQFRMVSLYGATVGLIGVAAIAHVVKVGLDAGVASVKQAFSFASTKMLKLYTTSFLMGFLILLLFLLFIIPGIVFLVFWTFYDQVVIFTDKSNKAALDYSKMMVKGRWWSVFWYCLVLVLMQMIVLYVAGILEGLLPPNFVVSVISSTLSDLVNAFFSVIYVVFFLNIHSLHQSQNVPPSSAGEVPTPMAPSPILTPTPTPVAIK